MPTKLLIIAASALLFSFTASSAGASFAQQGAKLVATGAVDGGAQGSAVAVSGDGNTAVVGCPYDNGGGGAAWVYTRSGGVWSQQGAKLVGTGAVGAADQGSSVAVSADGNTAVVGGYADNVQAGAAWVYTRSGGVWSQQGAKLVDTGAGGSAQQGSSVAVSGDGNAAVVGGRGDNLGAGAAWIYTRSGGVWSQQGAKLVGTGAVGAADQGTSVAVSADGNTAVVGGDSDSNYVGAAWVFAANTATGVNDGGSRTFALEGVRPNPTRGNGLNVAFTLPIEATAARLELLDVSGRRVLSREVGSLGAGRHTVNLAEGRKVAPGVYWVRLTQGASWRSTRVAVIE